MGQMSAIQLNVWVEGRSQSVRRSAWTQPVAPLSVTTVTYRPPQPPTPIKSFTLIPAPGDGGHDSLAAASDCSKHPTVAGLVILC